MKNRRIGGKNAEHRNAWQQIHAEVRRYGADIIASPRVQSQKKYLQHGSVTVYDHTCRVACVGLWLAEQLGLRIDKRALVRGALLHDYFLYDWHVPDASHRLHGFTHARCALRNAQRDFQLCPIECDIIEKHMFPLNIRPPKYRESVLICIADKISATIETVRRK